MNRIAAGDLRRLTLPAALCLLCVCLLPACQSSRPPGPRQTKASTNAPTARPADLQFAGKVIRVNAEMGYILVECAVLPNTDEEVRVLRGEQETGRVRFTGPFSYPYATADVIEGRPMVGDRVRK